MGQKMHRIPEHTINELTYILKRRNSTHDCNSPSRAHKSTGITHQNKTQQLHRRTRGLVVKVEPFFSTKEKSLCQRKDFKSFHDEISPGGRTVLPEIGYRMVRKGSPLAGMWEV